VKKNSSPAWNTIEEEIRIGELNVRINRISDIDSLFNSLIAKGDNDPDVLDERIPYWAELWPSAIALSKFLVEQKVIHAGAKVLEIGCGLGLPGIVAAKLGANVIFSDYLPEALEAARMNAHQNGISDSAFLTMDWRKPEMIPGLQFILASDVAYERRSFESLMQAFDFYIRKNVVIILSEPNRAFAKPFLQDLNKSGFELASYTFEIPFRNHLQQVNVYRVSGK